MLAALATLASLYTWCCISKGRVFSRYYYYWYFRIFDTRYRHIFIIIILIIWDDGLKKRRRRRKHIPPLVLKMVTALMMTYRAITIDWLFDWHSYWRYNDYFITYRIHDDTGWISKEALITYWYLWRHYIYACRASDMRLWFRLHAYLFIYLKSNYWAGIGRYPYSRHRHDRERHSLNAPPPFHRHQPRPFRFRCHVRWNNNYFCCFHAASLSAAPRPIVTTRVNI